MSNYGHPDKNVLFLICGRVNFFTRWSGRHLNFFYLWFFFYIPTCCFILEIVKKIQKQLQYFTCVPHNTIIEFCKHFWPAVVEMVRIRTVRIYVSNRGYIVEATGNKISNSNSVKKKLYRSSKWKKCLGEIFKDGLIYALEENIKIYSDLICTSCDKIFWIKRF